MKTNYKSIPINLWDTPEFKSINHLEKLLYLYLVASPVTRPLGVFPIDLDWIAYQFHISAKKIGEIIEKFEKMRLVTYSCKYKEIYLRYYLVQYATSGGPPLLKLLKKDMITIRDRQLLKHALKENQAFMDRRKDYYNETVDRFLTEALENFEIIFDDISEQELPSSAPNAYPKCSIDPIMLEKSGDYADLIPDDDLCDSNHFIRS